MAKKIETCMFCEATPCECEGAPKPKRTRTPRKKADNVDEPRSSSSRVRKPRAPVEPDVAGKEAVDEQRGSVAERSGLRSVDNGVRPDVARVRDTQGAAPVRHQRERARPDEVRAMRTLNFQGLLAPEEVIKHADVLEIHVEGKMLGEV